MGLRDWVSEMGGGVYVVIMGAGGASMGLRDWVSEMAELGNFEIPRL